MKARFGRNTANVLGAAAILGVVALLCVTRWYTDDDQAFPVTWWSLPGIALVTAVVIARVLRSTLELTDDRITRRGVFTTRVVPWRWFAELERVEHPDGITGTVERRPVHFHVGRPRSGVTFRSAYDRVTARKHPDDRSLPYPRPGRRWLTWMVWASAVTLLGGGFVVDLARRDDAAYRARAARDRRGSAVVIHSRVDEKDRGESGIAYETVVDVRLLLARRTVDTTIRRPGPVAWRYPADATIAVVYDRVHPDDADFGDRHNRNADASSVRIRRPVGWTMTLLGALGLAGFGAIVLYQAEWCRGVKRRIDPRPR